MTFFQSAADLIALIHALFSLFVLAGPILLVAGLLFDWRWTHRSGFRIAHLGAILFVTARAWLGLPCPLTWLENHLRHGLAENHPGVIQGAHALAFRGENPDRFRRAATAWAVLSVLPYAARRRITARPDKIRRPVRKIIAHPESVGTSTTEGCKPPPPPLQTVT